MSVNIYYAVNYARVAHFQRIKFTMTMERSNKVVMWQLHNNRPTTAIHFIHILFITQKFSSCKISLFTIWMISSWLTQLLSPSKQRETEDDKMYIWKIFRPCNLHDDLHRVHHVRTSLHLNHHWDCEVNNSNTGTYSSLSMKHKANKIWNIFDTQIG